MSGLEKATLTKLSNDPTPSTVGDPIAVQFNPASLKLTLGNASDAGQTRGRQTRQHLGNTSTELAFDLVFDTADEDDGSGGPRSVRERTGQIEQFVLPEGTGAGQKPPSKLRFHWGDFVLDGTVGSLSIDFDLFAADGTPLRAKMAISIKEQDAKYEIVPSTAGSSPPPAPPAPGEPGGGGTPDRTGEALDGESAADFSVRMGLDAGAWRGVAAGLEGTLSLSAGLEIDFSASVGLSAGIGVSAGVDVSAGISLDVSLGMDASAGLSLGAAASLGA
ncbi:MAG TPA: hypothetical protein VFH27_05440, partial [Longimicrobiaceae bacterium]|nr:hypothetical protein [Longimicrobiaceae bacterium]